MSVGRWLVIFEGGLRPPYFLITLGIRFVSSSGALLSVVRCLVIFDGSHFGPDPVSRIKNIKKILKLEPLFCLHVCLVVGC